MIEKCKNSHVRWCRIGLKAERSGHVKANLECKSTQHAIHQSPRSSSVLLSKAADRGCCPQQIVMGMTGTHGIRGLV